MRNNGYHRLRYAHLVGWGMDLPERILPNAAIEASLNLEENWIFPRTGIRERRIAAEGETATQFAVKAAQRALDRAGIQPEEIDLVLVATSTPEHIFPSTACLVQNQIGAVNAGACDVAAACSGFVYALDLATCKVRSGSVNTALVIGAETMTRVLDWKDRKTCVLFGDGAGAVVLRGSDEPGGVMSSVLRSDGAGWEKLTLPTVGSKETYLADGVHQMHTIYMDGRAVFDFAVGALSGGLTAAVEAAGISLDEVDVLIPHQANRRIIEEAANAIHFPMDKIYINLDRYGNTSAASVPIALAEAANEGRFQPGDVVGLVGFGAGLSWGAMLLEWSAPPVLKDQAAVAAGQAGSNGNGRHV
ncbi:MAG TPA: beta-ketoacyl-ACP synthase III [Aggregatilineaceae bacterium]|nr:beta-ketoacyl-ACP synthase III [Aggregatilineaceae bacterium]